MDPLWGNIFRGKKKDETIAGFLGTVPIFEGMSRKELAFLEGLVHVRNYSPEETVFEEGDPGSGLYVIRSGRVSISDKTPEGERDEIALLGPGDFFGETTLAAPARRAATARTLESTELVGLFRADLLEAAQKHPAMTNRILLGLTRIISERLQAAGQEVRRLKRSAQHIQSAPPAGETGKPA